MNLTRLFVLCLFMMSGILLYAEDSYMDIPIFPGATAEETMNSVVDENIKIGVKTYLTSAPFDDVIAFYKEKLPKAKISILDSEGERITVFNLFTKDSIRIATITQMQGDENTNIGIVKQDF